MRDTPGSWRGLLRRLRGEPEVIETDLSPYREILSLVDDRARACRAAGEDRLREMAVSLRRRALDGAPPEELLAEAFALVREAAGRSLGMRPYDVQLLAGIALHQGKLAEMGTGEGKTLAAVPAAFLHGLYGRGVHILTFNDYLARRDAAWMGPVYERLGMSVAAVQEGMDAAQRRRAYRADVTYATAKEAGFDFLRLNLARDSAGIVHRPFHFAIVDEADSILIDEARVPLVIAGERPSSSTDPYRIAALVRKLSEESDFDVDEARRNVFLTESGFDRIEAELGCGDLHDEGNYLLLTEVHQALHARVLLRRDVDYLVRGDLIELVDELTGRVVEDRRWPDGLQAALEAKEGVSIRPGGRILGSITLQHFLNLYPHLAGMTATAQPAATELAARYGLKVVVIPPNRPGRRSDLPDRVFARREAKREALLTEIERAHHAGRPMLVGTASVEESEDLARALRERGVDPDVLNARNDEQEAEIIAGAGAAGALTISTNMAGRGTDIRLGGAAEGERARVVSLGGLHVIGTNRHESRRIDDQLRGRAGRQGDPGESCFFLSLDDPLIERSGIGARLAGRWFAGPDGRIEVPGVGRAIDRAQRAVESQNAEIRETLCYYSSIVEAQRAELQSFRLDVLGGAPLELCRTHSPERYAALREGHGDDRVQETERQLTLHHLDRGWEEHLARLAHLREGIHLVRIGGVRPLEEFQRQADAAYRRLREEIEGRIVADFETLDADDLRLDPDRFRGPSSTWTYLVNDRALGDVYEMFAGSANYAFAAGALLTGPLLVAWGLWRRHGRSKR